MGRTLLPASNNIGDSPQRSHPCPLRALYEMWSSSTGSRTPFGKAGPKGIYAETRADDLVVAVIRELLRRHPELPPERIDEVAIAATTQIGDQGLTLGRVAGCWPGCRGRFRATRSTGCAPAR